MWSKRQRYWLAANKVLLAAKASQFKFYNPRTDTYVGGWVTPSDGHGRYQLKVPLGPGCPDEMPLLYVVSPLILPKYGGGAVNEEQRSHAFHTWKNGPGGCVSICHNTPGRWNPKCTILGIVIKGLLWVEAYSRHLKTGMSIASFFEELRRPGQRSHEYPPLWTKESRLCLNKKD